MHRKRESRGNFRRRVSAGVSVLVLGVVGAAGTGCVALAAGAAAGAGTYAYVRGELKEVLGAPMDRAWTAVLGAARELELNVEEESKDAMRAQLDAKRADSTNIRIRLIAESDTATEIRIRIGVFGNEAESRRILDAVKSRL